MAEVNPPMYQQRQCYPASEMRQPWQSLLCSDGAVGDGLTVIPWPSGGMQVRVNSGTAWIAGDTVVGQGTYFVRNEGFVYLDVTPGDPTDDRIDTVVARVYDGQYSGTEFKWALEIIEGSPSPAPVPPPLPDNTIVLAQITVPAGAISANDITVDTSVRQQAKICESYLPTYVAGRRWGGSTTQLPANTPTVIDSGNTADHYMGGISGISGSGLNIPAPGWYQINAGVLYNNVNDATQLVTRILINGTSYTQRDDDPHGFTPVTISTQAWLEQGDEVEVSCTQNSSGTGESSGTSEFPYLGVMRVIPG